MSRHHHRTVIRREHPRASQRRILALLALLLTAVAVAFWWGYTEGARQLQPMNHKEDGLRDRITLLESQRSIDRNTLEQLRVELAESRGSIDELQRELAFYREVIAPEDSTEDVVLRQPVFSVSDSDRLWRYQLVVQKGGSGKSLFRGELTGVLKGELDGESREFALSELDTSRVSDAFTLNFRYFQRFEGEIRLPEGFEPWALVLDAAISKPRTSAHQAQFDWSAMRAQ